ncbi:hypothetical protein FSC37_22290 [Piscinibacter aquaticus]|uniref:Uncharacterized protein n=1 Tax=Piscinibacter aquaticus TaxID=392597 RepID=A0A5C6TPD9_9BURK|nr:hypothetical protein FSC37_22290 [Piscinibacter aquaticus]
MKYQALLIAAGTLTIVATAVYTLGFEKHNGVHQATNNIDSPPTPQIIRGGNSEYSRQTPISHDVDCPATRTDCLEYAAAPQHVIKPQLQASATKPDFDKKLAELHELEGQLLKEVSNPKPNFARLDSLLEKYQNSGAQSAVPFVDFRQLREMLKHVDKMQTDAEALDRLVKKGDKLTPDEQQREMH